MRLNWTLIFLNSVMMVTAEGINNWAVLVDTSASWFNYRHYSNVLSAYEMIKMRGIPDDRIILMLAEDIACNSRNVFPGLVVNNEAKYSAPNLLMTTGGIEVDYRGNEVTVENFIRLLTSNVYNYRLPVSASRNKRLESDENSNILIFMTGHGGENFLKFRNVEEISSDDLSDAFLQMWNQKRYREILFIIDTCQAGSMYSKFTSPNIFSIASSKVGESSYSYIVDGDIGLSVIDKFSHLLYEFLKSATPASTVQQFLDTLDPNFLSSTPNWRGELFSRNADEIKIFDFFSNNNQKNNLIRLDPKSLRVMNTSFENANTNSNKPAITQSRAAINVRKSNSDNRIEQICKIKFYDSIKNTNTNNNTNTFILTGLLIMLSVYFYYDYCTKKIKVKVK